MMLTWKNQQDSVSSNTEGDAMAKLKVIIRKTRVGSTYVIKCRFQTLDKTSVLFIFNISYPLIFFSFSVGQEIETLL